MKRTQRDNKDILVISTKLIPRYIYLLLWVLGIDSNRKSFFLLGERIISLHNKSGSTFTVKYLKESLRIIQKFISGEKVGSSIDVGMGLSYGLPRILPAELRSYIRSNSVREIRAILTIISIFRVLKCTPKVKINTITDPFSGLYQYLNPMEVKVCMADLVNRFTLHSPKFLMLQSAGPNKNPSALGLPLDAFAFMKDQVLLDTYVSLARGLKGRELSDLLLKEIEVIKDWVPVKEPILGKLSFLKEAAGKVRVVAILDGWSQSLLSGLELSLSRLLDTIPQDGTTDQPRPLRALLSKGPSFVASFDLSAATDRLPIALQVQVLSNLIGLDNAQLWRSLLVDRDYHCVSKEFNLNTKVRYSVGQPMGSLSSFKMLALTHHIIVQISARRAGIKGWFDGYALVGDDIVIADKSVATCYHQLMMDLGMEINPHKSLTSNKGVCEFIKRLVSPTHELTPLGPRNLVQAMFCHNMIPGLFRELANKGWDVSTEYCEERFSKIPLTFLKGRKSLKEGVLWAIQGPFGFVSLGTRLSSGKQAMNSFNPLWLGNLLARIRMTKHRLFSREWELTMKKIQPLQWKVESEWSSMLTPGFIPAPSLMDAYKTGRKGIWFRSILNVFNPQDITFGKLPSYGMILEKYNEALDALWRSKPNIMNQMPLNRVDMLSVYTGKDIITPEIAAESPVRGILTDLFGEEPKAITRDVSRPAKQFWKEFSKVEFDQASSLPINPIGPFGGSPFGGSPFGGGAQPMNWDNYEPVSEVRHIPIPND